MKPLVYLAGPMSGYPDHNRPAFHGAASVLRKIHGHTVVNPAELDDAQPLSPGDAYTDYYRRDLEYLRKADMIVVLPGWQRSTGATYEVATMYNLLQCPVLEYPSLRKLKKDEIPQLTFKTNIVL